jgi:magnesium chelatase subunit I
MTVAFPFTAIVGQEEMKTALLVASVDQSVGGVLVFGTAARASPRRSAPWRP